MTKSTLVLLVALPVLGSGCSFAQNARRNIALTPLMAHTEVSQHHRNMLLAREAFRQMAIQFSDHEFSCDYRLGFVDGFADYLDFGGTGEPPPMPAIKYRSSSYMTPEGLAAMEDWKLGWRHGAATAKVSNLRELNTLPVYWGPTFSTDPPKIQPRPEKTGSGETVLPVPKKVDPADKAPVLIGPEPNEDPDKLKSPAAPPPK